MKKLWTKEELEFLDMHFSNMLTKQIADKLGRSYSSVSTTANLRGLKKSWKFLASEASGRLQREDHRGKQFQFKKGVSPVNKGKKQIEYMKKEAIERTKATRFHKGNIPHNTKEDFAISIRTDNRGVKNKFIRIALGKWIPLARYNWEQAYGPLQKGDKVVFKDGDTMNCDISNLEKVSTAELMRRNTIHNYPKEIVQVVHLRGVLNRKINKQIKKANNEK